MTSALRGREGGWSKRDDSTDRLREWDSDKGGVGPKIRKFCGRHLSIAPMANFGQVPPIMFIAKLAKVHCFLSMFIHMPLPIPDLVANLCNSFRKCCDCSPIITRIHCDSLTPLRRLVV